MSIGRNIKAARKKVGMSQKALGEKLGVSGSMIGQYETGARNPKIETLSEIASALGVHVSELVGLNPSVETPENRSAMNEVAKMLIRSGLIIRDNPSEEKLYAAYRKLNEQGQQKAVERVEELTEIPKYQRQPEEGEESAVDPQEND